MRKACLYIAPEPVGIKNNVFLETTIGEGMKNLSYPFIDLKKEFVKYGFDLSTRDINPPEESELVILVNDPHLFVNMSKKKNQVWALIIYESPVYIPQSWDPAYHERFDYIYTFDETLVDNKKYFYYPFAIDTEYFRIPDVITEEMFNQRSLATFVSNAIHKVKDQINAGSLIHRRYETIKWFGKNHPADFGFYGGTFRKRDYYIYFKGVGMAKRIFPRKLFHSFAAFAQRDLIKVFKGELQPLEKFEVIRKYKFYYCYENVKGVNGYLTEKIFDCLYSSVVPVYWGAPNVKELIPYKCFIDGEKFHSEESLYSFIRNMTYPEYRSYQEEAIRFLKSREMDRFTVRNFVDCIIAPLKNRLGIEK